MVQSLQKFNIWGVWKPFTAWLMLFFAVLASGMLYGCGQAREHKVHIQLSTWGSAQEVIVLKSLLHEFETENPQVRVDLLHIPENYYQKLQLLVAGDLTPDVLFTNSISFPIYASQGVFMDLKPLLTEREHLKVSRQVQDADDEVSSNKFYPASLQAFAWKTADGRTIQGALPRDISDVVIFYNKDLFQRAGVPEPAAHWTWDQFLETAKKLTVDTNNDGDPDQFGFSFYSKPPLFWLPFVWSAGGDLFSPDMRHIALDGPEALQGLRFYADLRNQWHVAPKKVESGGVTMSQLFLQQKVAMMVNGRWSVPVLREQAKFQWDVAPFPVGPSGKSRVGIDASGYAVSAKTAHPQESIALVRFLLSRKAIAAVTESGLIVPARRDVAESPLYLAPDKAPAHGRMFLEAIADGVPTQSPPRWNELTEELGLALEPVWDGQQDAGNAIKAVKPKLERILEVSP
jgi:multiple sugar transport system substrate-binding protein